MAAQTPSTVVPLPVVPGLPPIPIPVPGGIHVPNPVQGISDAGKLASKLLDPHSYVRLSEVAIGMTLVGIGIFVALKGPSRVEGASRTLIRTSETVTPGGRAAKSASRVTSAREGARARGAYATSYNRVAGREAAKHAAKPAITRK